MYKSILTLIFVLGSVILNAQTFNYVTSEEYKELKLNGQLNGNEVILSEGMVTLDSNDVYQEFIVTPKAQGCSGYFDPPGPGLSVTSADDGWTTGSPYTLPFTFCFFGDSYNQVWMNNNGNISFNGGISAYSSSAFPSTGNEMIAAFWADFDLGGAGTMHATITPTAAIFNWVQAGYFSSQADKLNTCQIVITDGTDPLVQGGNAAIHYADMQWTTGSASSGVNGFGGTPATCGANRGNNLDFFQIGRFDHEGVDYDGPAGNNDGVSWLDDKSFYFNFCTIGNNIEPIPLQTAYCDTFQVCNVGDTLDIVFPFLSPENTQTTTVTYSAPTLTNEQVVSNTIGINGELTLRIIGSLETVGIHEIVVTGTDDFVPSGVTNVTYWIEVVDGSTVFIPEPELNYIVDCVPVTIDVLNGPYDSYLWETGDTTSTLDILNVYDQNLNVIIEKSGCKFSLDSLVTLPGVPELNLLGSNEYCDNLPGAFYELADSTNYGDITWGLLDPVFDEQYSNYLAAGTYTISINDASNICSTDTTITVVSINGPQIINDTTVCAYDLQIAGVQSFSGGVWSSIDTAIQFSPSDSVENPLVSASAPGSYELTFTDDYCNVSLNVLIDFPSEVYTEISDTTLCSGANFALEALQDVNADSYLWNTGNSGISEVIIESGEYIVTVSNQCYSYTDTANVTFKVCEIYVPNVLSLSSTHGNELWHVTAEGIEEFECVIVNRWGNTIYTFNDIAGSWDGTTEGGKLVSEGTYFYRIIATDEGGEEYDLHGFIQVVH